MKLRWSCGRCRKSGTTPIESRQVWHRCELPERPKRRVALPEVAVDRESMRSAVWAGLAAALDERDPDWMLRKDTA